MHSLRSAVSTRCSPRRFACNSHALTLSSYGHPNAGMRCSTRPPAPLVQLSWHHPRSGANRQKKDCLTALGAELERLEAMPGRTPEAFLAAAQAQTPVSVLRSRGSASSKRRAAGRTPTSPPIDARRRSRTSRLCLVRSMSCTRAPAFAAAAGIHRLGERRTHSGRNRRSIAATQSLDELKARFLSGGASATRDRAR